MAKTWAEEQMKTIMDTMKRNHGSGWIHLSESQRKAYIAERIMYLVLSQALPSYNPAKEMIQNILTESEKEN